MHGRPAPGESEVFRTMDKVKRICIPWDVESLTYLQSHLGYKSNKKIAEHLGRSESAVRHKAAELKVAHPLQSPNYLSMANVAKMLGISWNSLRKLMNKTAFPWITLYQKNDARRMIHIQQLQMWLTDPMNWVYFPVETVTDPRLASIIKKVSREWGDEWIPVTEAARIRCVSPHLIYFYIYEGKLPAYQFGKWATWKILRSVAENVPFGRDSVVAIYCLGCKQLVEISGTLYPKLLFGDDMVVVPVRIKIPCPFCGRGRKGPCVVNAHLIEFPPALQGMNASSRGGIGG